MNEPYPVGTVIVTTGRYTPSNMYEIRGCDGADPYDYAVRDLVNPERNRYAYYNAQNVCGTFTVSSDVIEVILPDKSAVNWRVKDDRA